MGALWYNSRIINKALITLNGVPLKSLIIPNWLDCYGPVLWVLVAVGLFVATAGCQSQASTINSEAATSRPTATTSPTRTPTASITSVTEPSPTPEGAPISLTFWTVEPVSSLRDDQLGNFFGSTVRAFDRSNDEIEVEVLVKKASGKGGVLDFLRTARDVAPTVLPDVVVMDAKDLDQAYADGLIQPLDGRLDRSIVQDLLPAARRMGTVGDKLVGVPLGIEMEHTVYNTLVFTGTPMLWTDVLSKETTYLFPAKGINGLVNDFTLSQYFSAGGELINDEGLPKIDDGVLRDVLTFYQQAVEKGVIDPTILEASTTEELWPLYLEAQAGIAQVSVRQYLTDQELLSSTAFAPLPVKDEDDPHISVMHGWVLVLITSDVNRQSAALSLIETFLSTSTNATWNRVNKSIPTRGSSYQQLATEDPYWTFLTDQLNAARPEPRFTGYDRIGRIMQQAVEQVIRGEATAEEATTTVVDALAQ